MIAGFLVEGFEFDELTVNPHFSPFLDEILRRAVAAGFMPAFKFHKKRDSLSFS